jgi:hypothetical protein
MTFAFEFYVGGHADGLSNLFHKYVTCICKRLIMGDKDWEIKSVNGIQI